MSDKIKKIMEFISLPWKLIIAVGFVISMFVGLSTIDNRFAKSEQLDTLKTTMVASRDSAFRLAELQTVQTFQTFQAQQIEVTKTLQLQILNIQKEYLDKQYYNLRRELQKNPADIFLQEEFKDIKQQRIEIKQRIDNALN